MKHWDTVDGKNPANQLRLVVYPIISRVLYIPGGTRFLLSTVPVPLTGEDRLAAEQVVASCTLERICCAFLDDRNVYVGTVMGIWQTLFLWISQAWTQAKILYMHILYRYVYNKKYNFWISLVNFNFTIRLLVFERSHREPRYLADRVAFSAASFDANRIVDWKKG